MERSIEDLERYAKRERAYDKIQDEIEQLKTKINHSKEQDLMTFKDEIKSAIREEIVSRYFYQEGVVESSLRWDEDVKLALEILNSPQQLSTLLTARAK